MAKNMVPMPTGNSVLPKVFGWVVFIALVVIVVKYPGDAAGWVGDLWELGEDAVKGVVSFFRNVGS